MSTPATAAADKLKKLRADYIRQLPAQLELTRKVLAALDPAAPEPKDMEELHRQLHTLKGTCASFGLKPLSAAAADGEQLAKQLMKGEAALDAAWRAKLEDALARMEREVAGLEAAPEAPPQTLEVSAAAETHREAEQKLVYLCEDDPFQCMNLTTQIGCFGFKVVGFQQLDAFRDAVLETRPDVIVMDMVHPERQTGGAEVILEILAAQVPPIPVVFISQKSDLPTRLAAVRAGSSAYFVKPPDLIELCTTLHGLTSAEEPEPYRILIIDDDPHMSEMFATILQGAGMETRTLNDPLRTFPLLFDLKPDLILMDMHMPGCNGIELAKVIRQIDAYLSIPIVFLSSETDAGVQSVARRMGGDEFLVKPIKPEHLISAVTARAGRMKLIRSMMTRDGMTGLYNHSTTKEILQTTMGLALRNKEDACFAMLDMDHFKSINDTYGHPVGDQVLVALASLLKQRLRKSDVIGRYGGEEFAVILPGSSISQAAFLLDRLRECFAAIRFPVGDTYFNASFSCGVAQFDARKDVEALCAAADSALYTAKKEGRNRVIADGYKLPQTNLSGVSVLVVDDAAPIRAIVAGMLEALGCNSVAEAANGQEALCVLAAQPVNIIISDWHMPVMDGLELLKAVRADSRLGKLPFLMVSSESDKASVKQAILAGVSDYILKPVSTSKLSSKLARLLGRAETS